MILSSLPLFIVVFENLQCFKIMNFVYRHSVGLCKDGIGQSQDLCLHSTAQTRNTHTYIRVSSGIKTRDFKVLLIDDNMHLELVHVSHQPRSSFPVKVLFTFPISLAC